MVLLPLPLPLVTGIPFMPFLARVNKFGMASIADGAGKMLRYFPNYEKNGGSAKSGRYETACECRRKRRKASAVV